MSVSIELNSKEINNLICLNVVKMLNRRKLIDDVEKTYNDILPDINNKAIIEFKLNNNNIINIYFISAKISSISQGTPIDDFLSKNLDKHKIIILKETTKKVLKQIIFEYKNAEFFFEYEMLEDIPLKSFIPEHQLLSTDEKIELLSKYNESELSIILDTDMMARYFNAHSGDIFRIIRPSMTSGKSVVYRRVGHGSLDNLI
jgi:DNA-directed RNA polymerase subunit H (RpoH/RPB5)